MSRAGIEGIRAAIRHHIDNGTIAGAVSAVARHNRLVWYEAEGLSNPVTGDPMRRDSIFRMMSSTKPVTAVAVLMMADEGRLSLDDEVARFIPEFRDMQVSEMARDEDQPDSHVVEPAKRRITVRDLLSHTSGLVSVRDSPGQNNTAEPVRILPDDTLEQRASKIGTSHLHFQPGTRFAYSPTDAWDVALRIVEIVSGRPADRLMRERLFEPVEMRDTYFNVPAEKKSRIVNILEKDGGAWKIGQHLRGPGPYQYFSGGGGLFSTARDFMNFEIMLLNQGAFNGRRVLSPEAVREMTTNQVGSLFADWLPPMTSGHGFGLAVRIVEDPEFANGRSKGGFGWGGAYGTESWAEPERDLAAVFLLQMLPPPHDVVRDFERAVQNAIIS